MITTLQDDSHGSKQSNITAPVLVQEINLDYSFSQNLDSVKTNWRSQDDSADVNSGSF